MLYLCQPKTDAHWCLTNACFLIHNLIGQLNITLHMWRSCQISGAIKFFRGSEGLVVFTAPSKCLSAIHPEVQGSAGNIERSCGMVHWPIEAKLNSFNSLFHEVEQWRNLNFDIQLRNFVTPPPFHRSRSILLWQFSKYYRMRGDLK